MKDQFLKANILDIHNRKVYFGSVSISGSKIISIENLGDPVLSEPYIVPGLIDSHVHIESSMLVPSRFAEMVIPRGTIGIVCDPHEIANVLGREGVLYMMDDAEKSPLKIFFGVPSCVPATSFETSGGIINDEDVKFLFNRGALFLSEMMNYPGVLYDDATVKRKMDIARSLGKPIDGHAPGLVGDQLKKYITSGISTDHECSTLDEALQRIKYGMFVQIREGSAARNFAGLYPLLNSNPANVMLCTDDSHPDDIAEKGHIDKIVKMALKKGISIFDIYQAALINPVNHYKIPVGMLRPGDNADFIIVDNIRDFNVKATYIDGIPLFHDGKLNYSPRNSSVINNFIPISINRDELKVVSSLTNPSVRVIDIEEGELLTHEYIWKPALTDGQIAASIDDDIAKIVVVNRYGKSKPAVGFIRGFGISRGAFGSSIAHDSHNIVVVGCDDDSIVKVIQTLSDQKGGICCYADGGYSTLPLPVGGLMTTLDGNEVASIYANLTDFAVKKCGVKLQAPFMTLSFMSLLVIPSLKLGDKGLFNVDKFEFTNLVF